MEIVLTPTSVNRNHFRKTKVAEIMVFSQYRFVGLSITITYTLNNILQIKSFIISFNRLGERTDIG